MFRAGRSYELISKRRGGRVCFMVNMRWCNGSKLTSCSRDLETITVDCRTFYSPTVCVYRYYTDGCLTPPLDAGATSAMKLLAAWVTAIESAHPDSVVIVLGDFNHTNLKKFLPRYKQHVDYATRRNNKTLVHCYTLHKNAYNALVRAPLGESDHSTVLLIPTYRQKHKAIKPTKKVVRKMTDEL